MYKLKSIVVPDLLNDMTQIDELEVAPESLGIREKKVANIWAGIESLYRTGVYPGMVLTIRKHNQLLLNRALGHTQVNELQAHHPDHVMQLQTPVCLFSASKCITSVLIHWLCDQGALALDRPIQAYLPQFKGAPTGHITADQLINHRAGIPVFPPSAQVQDLFDPARALQLLAESPPKWVDNRQGYHALTSGFILGALLETLTGKPITDLVDELIAKPMGLSIFNYGLAPQHREKLAVNYATGARLSWFGNKMVCNVLGGSLDQVMDLCNSDAFLSSVIPSANFIATAYDLNAFFQMLMDKGVYQDQQILPSAMVESMIAPAGKWVLDRQLMLPVHFKSGFMFGRNPVGAWGLNSKHAFGHVGFTNNFCWADPKKQLSVALLTTGNPFIDRHLPHLLKWFYQVSTL